METGHGEQDDDERGQAARQPRQRRQVTVVERDKGKQDGTGQQGRKR